MSDGIETAQVDIEVARAIVEEAAKNLQPEQAEVLRGLLESYVELLRLLRERGTTIARLRRLFGLSNSERLAKVTDNKDETEETKTTEEGSTPSDSGEGVADLSSCDPVDEEGQPAEESSGKSEASPSESETESPPSEPDPSKKRTRTGGRTAAKDYAGPETYVPHPDLEPGDQCRECERGKVYDYRSIVYLVINGKAPLEAEKYRAQVLRCNTCGALFHAEPPPQAKGPKFRASAIAILAALHYTFGMPFHREEELQQLVGVPVAASTQWKLMNEAEPVIRPVREALERHAAASRIFHIDDTFLRLLEKATGIRFGKKCEPPDPERTGQFSTGILAVDGEGREIALFVTGRQHAGENLIDLLMLRPPGLYPPIVMSDALSRNTSGLAGVLMIYSAYCLAHARRGVVDQLENFPEDAEHVLRELAEVFYNDQRAGELGLSGRTRKAFHRKYSWPILKRLKKWIKACLRTRRVEPNSDMGKALNYILRHWQQLTLFLRQPDAPLTNNICERLIKVLIRYRKNSLFYKNERGAEVGDTFMALTHTAKLNGKNPIHYLTSLLEHPDQVAADPEAWLPWTYEETLLRIAKATQSADPGSSASAA